MFLFPFLAFQPRRAKRWTQRSKRSLRKRRRNSGKSSKFVSLLSLFFWFLTDFIELSTEDVISHLSQHDGEIQVLYQVTISPTLTNKKWSGKDLPIKAGEKLDVIVKAVDNKLICRNDEGKCEYLLSWNESVRSSQHLCVHLTNGLSVHLTSASLCFTVGYVSTSHIDME